MDKVTQAGVATVIQGLLKAGNDELAAMPQADLEGYWYFKWNDSAPIETNLYHFHDLLKLYGSFCRSWEEMHNGTCCVVERVRDTYLMPKIRQFAEKVTLLPNA